MLKIAVCDDEKNVRDSVKKCLDSYAMQRDLDIICREFSTGLDFLRDKTQFHIVILDYQLSEDKQINGMAVAEKLRSYDEDIHIIFLTSFPKVVYSSFEVGTFRFLVKPLEPEKLYKALDDYLKAAESDNVSLIIRIDGVNTVLNAKRIIYLEGMRKYANIHTDTDEIECREVLADVEKRLPPDMFFRCHRSFIVNLKYIDAYDSDQVYLANKQALPISKKKLEEFKTAFISYTKRHSYV